VTATVEVSSGEADAAFSLPAGSYRVCVTPLDAAGAPVAGCASFTATFMANSSAGRVVVSAHCDSSDGGMSGSGGAGGSGGAAGTGGGAGTGGASGSTGGAGAGGGGRGGAGGTGGTAGTGGAAGSGGSAGTGGTAGTGGVAGTAGTAGTGGTGACSGYQPYDYDGDGLSDCLLEVPGSTTSLRSLEFHKGLGPAAVSTTFATTAVITLDALPSGHSGFATLDMTGDGRADIVESCTTFFSTLMPQSPGYLFLRGNADGTFSGPGTEAGYTSPPPSQFAIAGRLSGDFNNDSRTDLVFATTLFTGSTGFANLYTMSSLVSAPASLRVSAGSPAINVGSHGTFTVGDVGDFNRDGNLDVVGHLGFVALDGTKDFRIVIASGKGDGQFLAATTVAGTTNALSARALDANGDGKLDLLVTFDTADGGLPMQTFYGDGAGNFSTTAP
jgi:hypothetical protein